MCLTFVSKCEKHLEERHFATVIQRFALLIWKSYLSGQDRQVLAESSIAQGCRNRGGRAMPPLTRGQIMSTKLPKVLRVPTDFQTYLRPCFKQIVDCRCLTENFTWKGNRCQNIWHNINKRYLFRLPYLSFSNIFSHWAGSAGCICSREGLCARKGGDTVYYKLLNPLWFF